VDETAVHQYANLLRMTVDELSQLRPDPSRQRGGAAGGVAVDIDERSLEGARRNLRPFPTMQVMRRSAYDLPFEGRFDLAFSIGVIHHLEYPQRALERMARAVKPGGRVLIWVYVPRTIGGYSSRISCDD